MKRYIILILVLIVSNYGNIISQNTMQSAIPVGTKSMAFTYTDTRNTESYTNDYVGRPTNDVFYQFTLNIVMDITITHCGSALTDTYLHLLNASGDRIAYNDNYYGGEACETTTQAYIKTRLSPGTYYVVSEGNYHNGNITTNISGRLTLPSSSINIGWNSEPFVYTDTQNVANFTNNYVGYAGNDICYILSLDAIMNVSVSHCGSEMTNTYIYILDQEGNRITYNNNYDATCSSPKQAFVKTKLPPGTYYIISEGNSQSGNITTTITGEVYIPYSCVNAGTIRLPFSYNGTPSTANFEDSYGNNSYKDIFYKFTISEKTDMSVSFCGSETPQHTIYLLDESGSLLKKIRTYTDNSICSANPEFTLVAEQLDPGVYYIVLEAETTQNTKMSISIKGKGRPKQQTVSIDGGQYDCSEHDEWHLLHTDYDKAPIDMVYHFKLNKKALVQFAYTESDTWTLESTKFVSLTNKRSGVSIPIYEDKSTRDQVLLSFQLEADEYILKTYSGYGSYNTTFKLSTDCESTPTNPGDGGATDPTNPIPTPTGKGITITYDYNIRSWTTNISSPHFSQKLYYNESNGNNTPQYNGNISAIEWNKGVDNSNRAYNFSYDQLSRLTAANYTGQANEKYGTSYSYDKHGNMRTLDRFGKINNDDKPDSYGAVDQLSFTYNGNQLKTITDGGANTNINESADFKSYAPEGTETHYTFNRNGAMTQDLNKGITNIDYNSLNLPQRMDIKSPVAEARNEYLYSASGAKLQVTQRWNPDYSTNPIIGTDINKASLDSMKVTDYVGNKIYENGELKKILVDGGYYDYEKEEYFFYIQDHLGNNRVVVNQNDSVVQRSDYYPFGMEFADNSGNDQPYKYNGKELDKMHGLNMYDYSARYVDPAYGRFTSVDPLAEGFYEGSPYVYVMNNPLRYTDPSGMIPVDSVDWEKFDPTVDDIDLKEVEVSATSPYVTQTIGGSTYRVNVFTGVRNFTGEAGLQNTHPEFEILLFARFLLGQGIKVGIGQIGKTVVSKTATTKLSQSAIEKGIQYAMDPNKVRHIFGKVAHNLQPLTAKLGGERNVIRAVLNSLNEGGHLAARTTMGEATVNIAGSNVTVRFIVHDGFPKIGTIFIP